MQEGCSKLMLFSRGFVALRSTSSSLSATITVHGTGYHTGTPSPCFIYIWMLIDILVYFCLFLKYSLTTKRSPKFIFLLARKECLLFIWEDYQIIFINIDSKTILKKRLIIWLTTKYIIYKLILNLTVSYKV